MASIILLLSDKENYTYFDIVLGQTRERVASSSGEDHDDEDDEDDDENHEQEVDHIMATSRRP